MATLDRLHDVLILHAESVRLHVTYTLRRIKLNMNYTGERFVFIQ